MTSLRNYMNGGTDAGTTGSSASGFSGRVGTAAARKGISTMTGMAMSKSGLSDVPGLSSGVKAALSGALNGKSVSEIGEAVARASTGSVVGSAIRGFIGGLPGIGLAAAGAGVAKEAFSSNPSYGTAAVKSTVPTIAAAMASMIAPPLAMVVGPLASYATTQSLEDGWMGDALDSRDAEAARDNLEYGGYSYGESASATSGEDNAPGTGGTPTEGANTEMGRASGDSGAGLGGGRDHGDHDSSGGMGGGSDRDSEPGGMGGV